MRVLVTWGSKRGGTEGIARIVGEALQHEGLDVDVLPAQAAAKATSFDAVIVGGALYANRWHPAARRFVNRQEKRLRDVPVWFFSSGPLDDSAERTTIAPTRQVSVLMERVGAKGHATFGGRLTPDARGFPASAMAKKRSGDWRQPEKHSRLGLRDRPRSPDGASRSRDDSARPIAVATRASRGRRLGRLRADDGAPPRDSSPRDRARPPRARRPAHLRRRLAALLPAAWRA